MMTDLSIILKMWHAKNKILKTIISALALTFAVLFCVSMLSREYIHQLHKSQEKIHGSFIYIRYQDGIYSNDHLPFGIIKGTLFQDNQKIVSLGHFNDLAKQMAFHYNSIQNVESNHVIITKSVANAYAVKLNETLTLKDKIFKVQQIIEDYGDFWIRGIEEEQKQYAPPKIIMNQTDFNDFIEKSENERFYTIFLANENVEKNQMWLQLEGNHYRNSYIDTGLDDTRYTLPDIFHIVLLLVFILVIFVLLYTYKKISLERYEIYRMLGKIAIQRLFYLDIFCLCLVALVIGLGVNFILSIGLLSLSYQQFILPNIDIYLTTLFKFLGVFIVVVLLFLVTNPMTLTKLVKSKRVKRKKMTVRLSKQSPIYVLMMTLFTASMILLLTNMFLYFNEINRLSTQQHTGQINQIFDYDITPDVGAKDMTSAQAFYHNKWHDNTGEKGISLQYIDNGNVLHRIQQQLDEQHIHRKNEKMYTMANLAYLASNQQIMNQPYIQLRYNRNVLIQNQLKEWIDEPSLLDISVVAFPDEDIYQLAQQARLKEDVSPVLSGDSVWIIATPYIHYEQKNEYGIKRFTRLVDSNTPDSIHDTVLSNNQQLRLIFLESEHTAYGYFSQDEVKQLFRKKEVTVPILTVTHQNIGRLDSFDTRFPYKLIVSKAFFQKHQLLSFPTKYRFSLVDGQNYPVSNDKIRHIVTSYGNVSFTDQYVQLETYRQYERLQSGFKWLLGVLFIGLTIVVLNSLIQAYIMENHHFFHVYLLLGMAKGRLLLKAIRPIFFSMTAVLLFITVFTWHTFFDLEYQFMPEKFLGVYMFISIGIYGTYLMLFNLLFYRAINRYVQSVYKDYMDRG